MKVLHVINDLATGGAERLLLDTLPLLDRRGVRADLVVLDDEPHPFLLELRRLGACEIRSTRLRPRDPRNALRLRSLFAGYDLVHAHLFPTMYWVASARALGPSRPPIVFTEHNVTNRRRGRLLVGAVDRLVYRRYAKVVCVSEAARDALASHAELPPERLVVVPNGIDVSRVLDAAPADRALFFGGLPSSSGKVILQVSSFRDQKDQDTIIRALPLLPPEIVAVFVGDGPRRPACIRLAREAGVLGRTAFLGTRDDVPALLRAADVVALSSRHEGLSLASIEGLASGHPLIASDAPGLRQVVEGAGLLFRTGDPEDFARVARRLLDDPDLARDLAERGAARARRHGVEAMIDRLVQVYESVLDGDAPVNGLSKGTRTSS